jgi:hypothetical protein
MPARRPHQRDGAQPLPLVRAADRGAQQLRPFRVGLPVIHQQIGVDQVAGRAEGQLRTAAYAGEPDHRAGQRAVGDRERLAGHGVIDDLVPNQHQLRVGPDVAAVGQTEHRFAIAEKTGLACGNEVGTIDRRDAILARPTGGDRVGQGLQRRRLIGDHRCGRGRFVPPTARPESHPSDDGERANAAEHQGALQHLPAGRRARFDAYDHRHHSALPRSSRDRFLLDETPGGADAQRGVSAR